MGKIQVRRLPDEVLAALRARSKHHGRSMEAEARQILSEALLPAERIKIGSMLADIGAVADLSPDEFAGFDNRDPAPAREVHL